MKEEKEQKARPDASDDEAQSQADSAEEQRMAQIMHRIALGDTSVTTEVYWMQLLDGSAKKKR